MSNIKKLLEGVEVEWKTLGEITKAAFLNAWNLANENKY